MSTEILEHDHTHTYVLNQLTVNPDVVNAWYFEDAVFSPEECSAIIEIALRKDLYSGSLSGSDISDEELRKVRDVKNCGIFPNDETRWIFDRIGNTVLNANRSAYDYNIIGMKEGLQFLHYEEGGHYNWHKDVGPLDSTRKLTAIVQLTDPTTYDGCDIEIEGGIYMARGQGSITVFPSHLEHRVLPHEGGAPRESLAVWVFGPPLK